MRKKAKKHGWIYIPEYEVRAFETYMEINQSTSNEHGLIYSITIHVAYHHKWIWYRVAKEKGNNSGKDNTG